jgi:ADP-ribose pyrophosphatase
LTLEPAPGPPYEIVSGEEVGRAWRMRLRREVVRMPDGEEGEIARVVAPPASVMVPVFEDGSTVLVRQWRPAWWESSWEVPAGTLEDGEDPLSAAKRELEEEAGLVAGEWRSLGTARGTALTTVLFHLYLARDIRETSSTLDHLERDLVTRRLPLADALRAAVSGEIQHSASIVALVRAAAALELRAW